MGNYDSLFADAQRTIAGIAGITVTYQRVSDTVDVTAVPARSSFDVEGENIITEVKVKDFLIASDDLILGGIKVTPLKGDIVTEASGDKVYTYIVKHPLDAKEQPWRYTDTGRSTLRIHVFLSGVA